MLEVPGSEGGVPKKVSGRYVVKGKMGWNISRRCLIREEMQNGRIGLE